MKHKINLLSSEEASSFIDSVVSFCLNYLRYALVFTQLIVLGVLFYRFTIDEQIVELKDGITQKKEVFRLVKPMLVQASGLEIQANVIDSSFTSQAQQLDMIDKVLLTFPSGLFLDKATIERRNMALAGSTGDDAQLRSYYNSLVKLKLFETVELKNIVKHETGYTFELILKNYLPQK